MQMKRQSKVSAHTARLRAWHIHKWYHGLSDDWEEEKHVFFAYAASSKGVRSFILDSGASMRLIVWADLTPEEKLTVRECDPVTLTTANGRVTSEWVVDVDVRQFDLTLEFNILTGVPPIFSLGKVVMDHGLKYTWDKAAHARPFLDIPTGPKKKRGICQIHINDPNVYTAVRNDVVAYTEQLSIKRGRQGKVYTVNRAHMARKASENDPANSDDRDEDFEDEMRYYYDHISRQDQQKVEQIAEEIKRMEKERQTLANSDDRQHQEECKAKEADQPEHSDALSEKPKRERKTSPSRASKQVNPGHGPQPRVRTFCQHNQFTHFGKDRD